jgi:hypothetical protein
MGYLTFNVPLVLKGIRKEKLLNIVSNVKGIVAKLVWMYMQIFLLW